MSSNHPAQRLRGRSSECEVLERLISGARSGQSQVLVLRGEAGIGKTALLEYVSERASGFCVVRAAGVQSDMELAFAGLQQLCAPLLDRRDRLPEPQRDALTTAFGLSAGTTPDRFLVGLAVLSLLAAAAEDEPVVCLIDDAQWLDRVSAQTLAFVARRLMAEPVALVFASREASGEELTGLPELTIRGLRNDDARALLDSAILGRLDERVRDRIVAETRGNPLALLELPRDITAAELAGGFALPDAGPLAGQIEQSFMRRIHSLPIQTQRLLLTAAAEPVGDAPLLTRAVQRLGIGADAAAPATAAGLVEIGTRVRFRHPLVRSAAYRAADLADRQEIHRALAEATDPQSDADRRAWHRAHAAVGPDEAVAAELERSADRAQVRGGVAAAAAFLQRATELTPDPARRAARGLAAAQAEFDAAALDAAYELLAMVDLGPLDELQRALVVRLRARIVFARSRGSGATPMLLDAAKQLLDAAKQLEPLDRALGRETYLEAIGAAMFAGRLGGPRGAEDAAEAADATPPGAQPVRPVDLLLDGMATLITRGHVVGVPKLRAALGSIQSEVQRSGGDVLRWLWLAFPIAQETAAHELWDDEAWHQLATHAVRLARDAGALAVLPAALVYRAGVHVQAGEFTAASALIEEAEAITAATGHSPVKYHSVVLASLRDDETAAVRLIEAAVQDATARGEGRVVALAGYATAVLYNGLGRYQEALAAAQRACEHEDVGFFGWTLVELVEAGARSGEHEVAVEALQRLEERTLVSGTDWALGVLARSRALLSGGSAAEELYREAIERLARTRIVVHLARAHLIFGEWLRRENRRVDAREQLHIAHEMLSRIGAEAFADRCRRELLATGETVRKRTTGSGDGLTAQEAQIARLAGEGLTNQEIGAQLFISSHTVEWHLRKVFAKLGIKSRRQLRGATSPR